MTQEKATANTGFTGSKYVKMLLVILMAFLLFGAPYVVYLVNGLLKMRFAYAAIGGVGCVVLGLVLMWYLIRVKIIK